MGTEQACAGPTAALGLPFLQDGSKCLRPHQLHTSDMCGMGAVSVLLTWLQVLHSVSAHQLELVNSMEGYVESEVLSKLKPVEKCWQPADFLPEGNDPDYVDKVRLLGAGASS